MKKSRNFNLASQKAITIFLVTILLTFSSYQFPTYGEKGNIDSYRGLVILKIDNLESNDTYAAIEEAISKDRNVNLDYSCVESGVLIIKFFDSRFNGKADNGVMIKQKVINAVPKSNPEIIFIDVQSQSAGSKC